MLKNICSLIFNISFGYIALLGNVQNTRREVKVLTTTKKELCFVAILVAIGALIAIGQRYYHSWQIGKAPASLEEVRSHYQSAESAYKQLEVCDQKGKTDYWGGGRAHANSREAELRQLHDRVLDAKLKHLSVSSETVRQLNFDAKQLAKQFRARVDYALPFTRKIRAKLSEAKQVRKAVFLKIAKRLQTRGYTKTAGLAQEFAKADDVPAEKFYVFREECLRSHDTVLVSEDLLDALDQSIGKDSEACEDFTSDKFNYNGDVHYQRYWNETLGKAEDSLASANQAQKLIVGWKVDELSVKGAETWLKSK